MAIGDTQVIELATGVFARLHEGLTNAGIIVGDDDVLVVDGLIDEGASGPGGGTLPK